MVGGQKGRVFDANEEINRFSAELLWEDNVLQMREDRSGFVGGVHEVLMLHLCSDLLETLDCEVVEAAVV